MNITKLAAIHKLEEEVISDMNGTVIDIETIGDFDKRYRGDSRE